MKTLAQIRKGQWFKIRSIPEERIARQAIRLGITERSLLQCVAKLPAGPVIFRLGRQEIAVGRRLAAQIEVSGGIRVGNPGAGFPAKEIRIPPAHGNDNYCSSSRRCTLMSIGIPAAHGNDNRTCRPGNFCSEDSCSVDRSGGRSVAGKGGADLWNELSY